MILVIGTNLYPMLFGPISLIVSIYLLSLLLWVKHHKKRSLNLGLKVIHLIPCGHWLYQSLARKHGVDIPEGSPIEMHLNVTVQYAHSDCNEALLQFRRDLETDLKSIKSLIDRNLLGANPVIVLNTFNRYWLDQTLQILNGKRYPGVVLTKESCNLYRPQKHKKILKKMFPNCTFKNVGRSDPQKWDLIISD